MKSHLAWLNTENNPLLNDDVRLFFARLEEKLDTLEDGEAIASAITGEFATQLIFCCYNSAFVCDQLHKFPDLIVVLSQVNAPFNHAELVAQWQQHAQHIDTVGSLEQALREFRNRAMVGIIWRDLHRLGQLEDTTGALTSLAEICTQAALDYHYNLLATKFGQPTDKQGAIQPLLVLGMGKLGAGELNLSSDIDLIFTFPQSGNTNNPNNPLSNQEFFSRLGKKVIHSLDAKTLHGFVFRVDMRLRPYGQSGALVSNFDSLEDYYQTQGREWERYAMVKTRIIAASQAEGISDAEHAHYKRQLMTLLRQFTYRKYVDFSVIDALRGLKQMITQEVKRRQLEDDVKLGPGGIREVEFIAQAFQLIRGGRDTQLQDNRLLVILPQLEELNCLPPGTAKTLADAYRFLRNTEHAIQAYRDEQTQRLPINPDDQLRLARGMGFDDWQSFYQQLNTHRDAVKAEFHEVIALPEEKDGQCTVDSLWQQIWQGQLDQEVAFDILTKHKHEAPNTTLSLLDELRESSTVQTLQAAGKERLDEFIPRLLAQISATDTPTQTLHRILKLVKSVIRRSAYLLLLIENPGALSQLVKLTAASPWIADRLAEHPALLDELLDARTLYHPPEKAELQADLHTTMLRIAEDDLETQMETLRHFRAAHMLRVAASELTGALPLMKVSDYLTYMAEVIVEYVVHLAWGQMVAKHGYPDGDKRTHPNFIVVGYGKVGGIELSHGSDLDLVFIHNANTSGSTDGERSIDNQTFYMRMGQKIIHIMNTQTVNGQLYEVDMRLRPSGNSGMLVTTLSGFEKYQKESAWTWEHQALVRARVIAGDSELADQFDQVRRAILGQKRELSTLRKDVTEMREKMRKHLGSDTSGDGSKTFNIKQDAGGIVDIEFMVQYAVLAWAHSQPALLRYTDNIRILECLAESQLLSAQEVEQLIEAYKALRSLGHSLALQQQANLVDGTSLEPERETVIRIWQQLFAVGAS